MNRDTFEKLMRELDGNSLETLLKKNAKYAPGDDALHNFHSGGDVFGGTAAQACWGYLTKHLVALRDKVHYLEQNAALCGVVRYPTAMTYNAGGSPFCGAPCACANI